MFCFLPVLVLLLISTVSATVEVSVIAVETSDSESKLIDKVKDASRMASLDALIANNFITVRLKCSKNASVPIEYCMINISQNDTIIDSTKGQQTICNTAIQPDSITLKVPDITHNPDDQFQLVIRNNTQELIESKPFKILHLVSLDARNQYIETWLSPTTESVFMNDKNITISFALKQPIPNNHKLIVKLTRQLAFSADRIMEISAAELQALTKFDGSKSIVSFIFPLTDVTMRKPVPAYDAYKFKVMMKRDGDSNTDSIIEGIKSLISFATDISDSLQFKIINSVTVGTNSSAAAHVDSVSMVARIPVISDFTKP